MCGRMRAQCVCFTACLPVCVNVSVCVCADIISCITVYVYLFCLAFESYIIDVLFQGFLGNPYGMFRIPGKVREGKIFLGETFCFDSWSVDGEEVCVHACEFSYACR
jgi:hypothetical protein